MSDTELAEVFLRAIERADKQAIRACYAENARIWHNFDGVHQTVEENLATLEWLTSVVSDRRYEIVRIEALPDGFLLQYVMNGTLKDGKRLVMPACVICTVTQGRITQLQEYLDPTRMLKYVG
ncbi:MAG: nuclear transport factor 2 family protein [Pseudomonadales bacterium]